MQRCEHHSRGVRLGAILSVKRSWKDARKHIRHSDMVFFRFGAFSKLGIVKETRCFSPFLNGTLPWPNSNSSRRAAHRSATALLNVSRKSESPVSGRYGICIDDFASRRLWLMYEEESMERRSEACSFAKG